MAASPIDPESLALSDVPRAHKPKVVYAIIDRPPRKHWLRVGLAFVNRDGSLNVRIDAVPLTGSLHIRDEPQRPTGADTDAASSEEPPAPRIVPKGKRP